MSPFETSPPVIVLDTNVVLDWLVFRDPTCAELGSALGSGQLNWVTTPAMRSELAHVLARGHLDAWPVDLGFLWAAWDHHCTELAPPLPSRLSGRLRCGDPDDQKFIDLAVTVHARWLLSRDRAVLKLARRLREYGVETLSPERWSLTVPG